VPCAGRFDAGGFVLLMAATLAGCAVFQLLRAPNAFVLGSLAVALALAAGFAVMLAWLTAHNPAALVLGTAPGGIAEMCITAKALQLGVPLVTACHVARLVALLLVTAPLFGTLRGWWRARAKDE
jgi:uncharacterized membrane protein AbrB (regulator of aidB expression)